jgi:hypothetical protein
MKNAMVRLKPIRVAVPDQPEDAAGDPGDQLLSGLDQPGPDRHSRDREVTQPIEDRALNDAGGQRLGLANQQPGYPHGRDDEDGQRDDHHQECRERSAGSTASAGHGAGPA